MNPDNALQKLSQAAQVGLFLDYDGTLAEFAPTPEFVNPDPGLNALLERLARLPDLRLAIISGRMLDQILTLVQVRGIWLAGTYGVELLNPAGERLQRIELEAIRPAIQQVRLLWAAMISRQQGFYLEDKGWSLALHAKNARAREAIEILEAAHLAAVEHIDRGRYQVMGGDRFLEVGPKLANKGEAVRFLLDQDPDPAVQLAYLGDDDKDELAFAVILERGGIPIVVSSEPRPTHALCRLESPQAVRDWLGRLLAARGG